MQSLNYKFVIVILLTAGLIRFTGIGLDRPIFDEGVHVPTAKSMLQNGTPVGNNWLHPPLGTLLMCGSITLLGDNPYGWRMVSVVFGTATVFMVLLIGMRLYPSGAVPALAASFLAADPFHAFFSRTPMMEIPALFFFLAFCYFMIIFNQNGKLSSLLFSGISLGFTLATKGTYFYIATLLIIAYSFRNYCRSGKKFQEAAIDFGVLLFVLAGAMYLLSYYFWFGRGYTFPEFMQMRSDALWFLRNMDSSFFTHNVVLEMGGKPWEWFLKPLVHAYNSRSESAECRFLLSINNFPVRLLVIPSICYLLWNSWKTKAFKDAVAPLIFCANYVLLLVVNRPIFDYSSIVLLPFAYISVARSIESIMKRYAWEEAGYWVVFALVLMWGVYTFPLYTLTKVPLALYRPILSITSFPEMY